MARIGWSSIIKMFHDTEGRNAVELSQEVIIGGKEIAEINAV